jgi:integrase
VELVQPIRSEKQIEAMKKILKAGNLRDYCMFVLGINCGLRIGGLLSLTIDDVVDEKGKVKDRIVLREQKTSKAKNFPIGDTSKKAMGEYLKSRQDVAPGQPLFPSRKGGNHIGRVQAYRIINGAARAVGITDEVGTHTLRKTFGYHAYKQCKDIVVIQKLLNHSAPSVTLEYIGITQDDKDSVYLNLNL